jgi:hypothetical protein
MTSEEFLALVRWNLGPGRVDFLPPGQDKPFIPLLLQLEEISPRDFAEQIGPGFLVPRLYTDVLPPEFNDLGYITALAERSFFDQDFAQNAGLPSVKDVALSPPLFRASFPQEPEAWKKMLPMLGSAPPPSGAVILGIIDDGIAFAHERFLDAGGTRVEYFWMQDGPPPGPTDIFGPFINGRELRKPTIDNLRNLSTHAGLVDEDEVYRRAGVVDASIPAGHKAIRWRPAHGTHVLDIACNTPWRPPGDPVLDPRIIAVQLPIATTGLPSTPSLAAHVIEGIWYILVRSLYVAERLGCRPLPVVINLSYGITDGPHDGTQIIERSIDGILAYWRARYNVDAEVVIASGNNHLDRLHAAVALPPPILSPPSPASVVSIPWRVQPGDRTSSVVEIWLPRGLVPAPGRFEVVVAAPNGGQTLPVDEVPGKHRELGVAPNILCQVEYFFPAPTGRGRFQITIQPTARTDVAPPMAPPTPVAPFGLWTIALRNRALAAGTIVDAYIARDEAPFGYPPLGRQSYFDDPSYVRFDNAGRLVEVDNASIVKRDGSMSAIATGNEPSVIGGVRRAELTVAPYSAGGPTLSRVGPDALAVSDDSKVRAGVLAAGSRSGSVVAMNGTSVAAPMVTRWVAGELAAGRSGNRAAVQAFAASVDPPAPPAPPPPLPKRGGWGRITVIPPARPPGGITR